MNKEKLIHQLFIGKVADIIGFEKTHEILKESHDAINNLKLSWQEKFTIDEITEALKLLMTMRTKMDT